MKPLYAKVEMAHLQIFTHHKFENLFKKKTINEYVFKIILHFAYYIY